MVYETFHKHQTALSILYRLVEVSKIKDLSYLRQGFHALRTCILGTTNPGPSSTDAILLQCYLPLALACKRTYPGRDESRNGLASQIPTPRYSYSHLGPMNFTLRLASLKDMRDDTLFK